MKAFYKIWMIFCTVLVTAFITAGVIFFILPHIIPAFEETIKQKAEMCLDQNGSWNDERKECVQVL